MARRPTLRATWQSLSFLGSLSALNSDLNGSNLIHLIIFLRFGSCRDVNMLRRLVVLLWWSAATTRIVPFETHNVTAECSPTSRTEIGNVD